VATINMNQMLVELDGKTPLMEIRREKGEEGKKVSEPIIFGMVCIRSLVVDYPEERGITGEDKYKRGTLATKINRAMDTGSGEMDLEAEEVVLLKNLIAKGYTPIIVKQTWDILEGRGPLEEKAEIEEEAEAEDVDEEGNILI